MKLKPSVVFCSLLLFPVALVFTAPCSAIIVTFDDLTDTRNGGGTLISNTYQGLVWSNFAVGNVLLQTAFNGTSGYYYGMITVSNVVTGGHGDPARIDTVGANFNFFSAYLTGAWRSNLNIEVEGFRNGNLLYDTTVVASATDATLFTFNYLNIDRLAFISSGGQYAGFSSDGLNFAMDNFNFEFVPEPSSLLLTCIGGLALFGLVRRSRVCR